MANVTTIYACTRSGLAVINKPGTLPQWLPPRLALQGRAVTSVWSDPGPPTRLVVVADGELLRSESGGRTWENVEIGAGAAAVSVFPTGEPHRLYAALAGGALMISQDSGVTWASAPALPIKGNVIAVGINKAREHVYMLIEDGGETSLVWGNIVRGDWSRSRLHGATALAVDGATGSLYVTSTEGIMMRSGDSLQWSVDTGSPQAGQAIIIIPPPAGKSPTVLVGSPRGLWANHSAGVWEHVELPQQGGVTALALDPERRDRVYAGTDSGYVFESANRGRSWQGVSIDSLPPITSLHVARI